MNQTCRCYTQPLQHNTRASANSLYTDGAFPPQRQPNYTFDAFNQLNAQHPGHPPPTTSYTYPTTVPQSFQQPVQQSQYFQSLPRGSPARPTQRGAPTAHNVSPSVPASPGNGPGAPPPERHSPDLDDDIMRALHRDNANDADEDDEQEDGDGSPVPSDAVYHLPAPPDHVYKDPEELDRAIHAWSLDHGYELVRRASKKNARGVLYKRFYHCSKHGRVGNKRGHDKEKVRKPRESNRLGCPMSLCAVATDPSDPSGTWRIKVAKAHHNHPAVEAVKLAGHRRRARMGGIEDAVDGLLAIDTRIPDVLKFLQRTHPDGLFTRADVANMKLKYKKYGTCANRDGIGERIPVAKRGVPMACDHCREKKTRCDSKRPTCGACLQLNMPCSYDYAGSPPPAVAPQAPVTPAPITTEQATPGDANSFPPFPYLGSNLPATTPTAPVAVQPNATELELRALLARFQAEHIKPMRMTLESSEVEYLATATCGNGSSYMSLPAFAGKDWTEYQNYRDAFLEAARKENTYDVLVGAKRRPVQPIGEPNPNSPGEYQEPDVKVWNEYIKQLAIYMRRNASLIGAMLSTAAPPIRARLRNISSARDMWIALEDMCRPRGSEQAFYRYIEWHSITLANSGSYDNYIFRLQSQAEALNYLDNESAPADRQRNGSEQLPTQPPNAAISESALCFQFLMGLGEDHRRLVDNLCKKNNVGGFGSGAKLGFKDVTRLVRQLMDT